MQLVLSTRSILCISRA